MKQRRSGDVKGLRPEDLQLCLELAHAERQRHAGLAAYYTERQPTVAASEQQQAVMFSGLITRIEQEMEGR